MTIKCPQTLPKVLWTGVGGAKLFPVQNPWLRQTQRFCSLGMLKKWMTFLLNDSKKPLPSLQWLIAVSGAFGIIIPETKSYSSAFVVVVTRSTLLRTWRLASTLFQASLAGASSATPSQVHTGAGGEAYWSHKATPFRSSPGTTCPWAPCSHSI